MIQLFYGDNDFSLSRAVQNVRDKFVLDHGEHSVRRLDADELSLGDLPQLLQGQSLFSEHFLSIIDGASSNKALWDQLFELMPNATDADLLLVDPKPDKRTRTFKWLQKNATVLEFKNLDDRQIRDWLHSEARSVGIELNGETTAFLMHHSGKDQWRLHNDIEKLSLSGKPITTKLIRDLIDPHPEASVFDLLDSIISGKQQQAIQILSIVSRSEDPYKFLGLLTSQLYALALCVHGGGRSSNQIATESGIHPYVAQRMLSLSHSVSKQRLDSMVECVKKCDSRLKSTGAQPWVLLEATIGELTSE